MGELIGTPNRSRSGTPSNRIPEADHDAAGFFPASRWAIPQIHQFQSTILNSSGWSRMYCLVRSKSTFWTILMSSEWMVQNVLLGAKQEFHVHKSSVAPTGAVLRLVTRSSPYPFTFRSAGRPPGYRPSRKNPLLAQNASSPSASAKAARSLLVRYTP